MFKSLKSDSGDFPTIRTDFWKTQDIADRCFLKPPLGFHMLVEIFGESIIQRFLTRMSKLYKFGNAGMSQWTAAWSFAAESTVAGKLIQNFFTQPGYPVLEVRKLAGTQLLLIQKVYRSRAILPIVNADDTFVLPINLHTSAGMYVYRKILVNVTTEIQTDASNSYYFLDGTSFYGRTLYEISNYVNLINCYAQKSRLDSNCSLNSAEVHSIFDNFCFGLLENQFPLSRDDSSVFLWTDLFAKLYDLSSPMKRGQSRIRLGNTCQCCLATRTDLKARRGRRGCDYAWNLTCRNLRIIKLLDRA